MDTPRSTEVNRPSGQGNVTRGMTEQVVERAGEMKEAVVDFGRSTVDSIDAHRRPAAVTLERTASALQQQSDRLTGAAQSAADTLRTTADYVRTHDMRAMGHDVRELVRRYPGPALVAATVFGFCVARAIRPRA